MEQNTNQPSQELNHKMPLRRNKKWVVFIFLILFFVALVFSLAYLYLNNFKNTPPKGIYAQIGNESITTKEFDEIYNANLRLKESNAKDPKDIDKKQLERKVADDVLMRLALENQAKKLNKQICSASVVDERLKDRYKKYGSEELYFTSLNAQYGWTKNVAKNNECLEFYKETLTNSIVGSVDLFGMYIRWDMKKGENDLEYEKKVDAYAKDRLEKEYLPMFERGDSVAQISAKADITPTLTDKQFNERVQDADRSPSRTVVLPQMNKATYSEFQQYKEGESELPYFENLKVGENTKPFKSKTGYWVIYRATGRSNAPFATLEAMRAEYIKKGKITKSYFKLPKPEENGPKEDPSYNYLLSSGRKIRDAIFPKANAATPNSVSCFTGDTIHNLPMTLNYKDYDTKQNINTSGTYPGPYVKSTGDVVTACKDEPDPAAYAGYGVAVTYYPDNSVLIKPAAIPAPTWSFGLTCWSRWRFNFVAPPNYDTLTSADYNNANRFYLTLSYATSTVKGNYAAETSRADANSYQIQNDLYTNVANGAKGFNIDVYFSKTPPPTYSGTISTNKRLASDSSILATGSTPGNALIELKSPDTAQPIFDSNSTSNPWNRSNVYVLWNDKFSNTPGRYYKNTITVPRDWRVNRVQTSLPSNGVLTNDGLSCTEANQSGVCTVSGLTVYNGSVTYVDWFLEKIPVPIPYYPWLQTKNGDVTSGDTLASSSGKITGQEIGPVDLNTIRGARRAGVATAESSFVVAANEAGEYFCSQERFVLGKSLEYRDNLDALSCQTGGYTPSPVDFNKVKASVAKAYSDNGNGAAVAATNKCNPKYATTAVAVGTPPNLVIDLGCPAGGIQKIGGQGDTVTLSSLPTVNGRGTLWIPGKLIINNDIKYSTTNSTNDPKTTPNLVIFVEGDVEIAPNVQQIDASIISKGAISTCNQSTVSTRACENKLVINGFLASDNKKINFARRYYATPYATATPSPAELINLTSQSTTFPAPGLDRTDTDVTSKLQINSGEFAPRLK